MRTFAAGSLLWFLVVFGLFNAGLPHDRLVAVSQTVKAGRMPPVVEAVRAYTTNDGDVRRYFAYAEAALGLPYESYFVRPAPAWRRAFAAGEGFHPDDMPTITPTHALMPYRDFLVEYPPGFFLAALPPAWVARDGRAYLLLFQSLMAGALTAAFVLMRQAALRIGRPIASGRLAAWAALGALALGVVTTHRCDAAVALTVALASWALVTGRAVALGVAVAIAVCLKGVPLLIAPLIVMHAVRDRRLRALGVAGLAGGLAGTAIGLPAMLAAGKTLIEMARYHLDRPLQIETIWGGVLGLLHAASPASIVVEKTFGSTNLVGRFTATFLVASNVVTLLGLLAVYVATWRRLETSDPAERGRAALEGIAASLAVYIACAKVCSPQYLVWLLPIGLVLSLTHQRRRCLALLMAALTLTQLIYPISYAALESLRPWACLLVIVRNLLLLAWARFVMGGPAVGTEQVIQVSGSPRVELAADPRSPPLAPIL